MKPKHLFVGTALLYVPQAVVTLLTPATSLSMYGAGSGQGAAPMAQWAGLGSMVVGLLAWFARHIPASEGRRAIVRTMVAYFTIGAILSLVGTVSGDVGPAGWALVVVNAVFVVAYAVVLKDHPQGTESAPAA